LHPDLHPALKVACHGICATVEDIWHRETPTRLVLACWRMALNGRAVLVLWGMLAFAGVVLTAAATSERALLLVAVIVCVAALIVWEVRRVRSGAGPGIT
jgi:hypothetical protein